jgi:Adenosine deaminase
MNTAQLARVLPKVELHCHLEGAARPATVVDLARSNGIALPVEDPTELFRFANLTEFLDVYAIICASLRTADDLRRVTYEALEDAAAVGVATGRCSSPLVSCWPMASPSRPSGPASEPGLLRPIRTWTYAVA